MGLSLSDRLHHTATNPRFWMAFHAFGIARWALLFPPGMIWWRGNIPFLMYVSLDTALTGSIAGFGAALAARKADPEDPL